MNRLIVIVVFLFVWIGGRNLTYAEIIRVDCSYMFKSSEDYSIYSSLLRESMDDYRKDYGVNMKQFDNFAQPNIPKFSIYMPMKDGLEFGTTLSAYGTGAVIAYSDYSGSIVEEVSLNTKIFGVMVRKNLNKTLIDSRLTLKLGINLNFLTTEYRVNSKINILGEVWEKTEFDEESVFVAEPSISFLLDLDYVQVGYNICYVVEIAENYLYKMDRNGINHGAVISIGL